MKHTKFFLMAAIGLAVSFASCSKDDSDNNDDNNNVTNIADTVAVNNLIAYFKFNGDVVDKKGQIATNNGVTFTTDRFATASKAYKGGAAAYAEVVPSAKLKTMASMTYSVWLRSQKLDGGAAFIFTLIDPAIDWNAGIGLWQEGDNRMDTLRFKGFTMHKSSAVYTWLDTKYGKTDKTLFPTSKWFQVAYTYNSSDGIRAFYLNGSKVLQDTIKFVDAPMGAITIPATATNFFIGKNPNTSQGWIVNYLGDMDDLRFYDKALTSGQIDALYRGEKDAEGE
ncbi:LamG domain-containing protein [Williamwhitmania taraxaci]|uniref:Concanavalin A-like lectin/glucanases superfamily protein n=1 Tax=Williamwhitmania taraxaci TaxID=1640674 RepID=A0A1G6MUH5_9BACT|nr:LamG domain-containing protein [Williamwhitmania taraxaci]SDC58884.1 Concanavalin A-like lectin/glucanases superfamily protein [Williamwhitmania taraxaci]